MTSLWPSKQLAIVDVENKKIVRTIDSEYIIRSLAWAPDSEYFAVLYDWATGGLFLLDIHFLV